METEIETESPQDLIKLRNPPPAQVAHRRHRQVEAVTASSLHDHHYTITIAATPPDHDHV